MKEKGLAAELWEQSPILLVAILLILALWGLMYLAVEKAVPQQLAASSAAAQQVPEHIRLVERE